MLDILVCPVVDRLDLIDLFKEVFDVGAIKTTLNPLVLCAVLVFYFCLFAPKATTNAVHCRDAVIDWDPLALSLQGV